MLPSADEGVRRSTSNYSNSEVRKNSCDDVSYSTRKTFGLQQTWQSST